MQEPILIEDSESDTDSDCSDWDSDCRVSEFRSRADKITGYHMLHPVSPDDPVLQPKKKCLNVMPELQSSLLDPKVISEIRDNSKREQAETKAFETVDLSCFSEPFQIYVVKNFLEDKEFLQRVRDEFNEIDWNTRNLDLYEFFQSRDLKSLDLKHLKLFYNFLHETVMPWVSNITGFELTHVSATCSVYTDTDYLLVHDDQQEDRIVAFILYITEQNEMWLPEYGGALQLFARDSDGQPSHVTREILPSNNQFVFFPVTNESYHQVAEVTNTEHCRLSINGWFHGPKKQTFSVPIYKAPVNGLYSNNNIPPQNANINLNTWISDVYLNKDTAKNIQKQIEDNSEISLKQFFKKEVLKEIVQALQSAGVKWETCGPINRRSYETLNEKSAPTIVKNFIQLFQSSAFFELLHRYSDLDLDNDGASMRYEFQKWEPGCYSLLSDYDWQNKNELDVILYLGCDSGVVGGQTQYIALDEEVQNALITIEPEENNLNIIFRDIARITKYVSKQSICKCFFVVICSYTE